MSPGKEGNIYNYCQKEKSFASPQMDFEHDIGPKLLATLRTLVFLRDLVIAPMCFQGVYVEEP